MLFQKSCRALQSSNVLYKTFEYSAPIPSINVANIQFEQSIWVAVGINLNITSCDIHLLKIILYCKTLSNSSQLHISESQIGSNIIIHDGKAKLENCNIISKSVSIHKTFVIGVKNSTVLVKSSCFENFNGRPFLKAVSGKVHMTDVKFANYSSKRTAIIFLTKTVISLKNCTFTKTVGPSLVLRDKSNGSIENSTFEHNKYVPSSFTWLRVSGSIMKVKNSRFGHNTHNEPTILFTNGSLGLLEDSNFTHNTVDSGATVSTEHSLLSVNHCWFTHNKGGALAHRGSTNITVSNCVFLNNSAEYGGAILLFSGGNQENRRSGNRRGSGAEITNIAQEGESAAMPIFNCTFADNTAQLGGAIYTENVSVSVENCRFMNNRAVWNQHIYDGTGGAICLLPVNREASLTISNSTFEQNNASRSGGAVASGPSTNIQGSRFVNNSAINAAGAVYIFTISSPLETEANVSDCRFLGNTAAYGGAIFTKEGSLTVHNSFFEHNTAVQNETPESGRGGAISHHPPSVHDSLCVSNSTFIQNIALVGGAIALAHRGSALAHRGSTNIIVSKCVFLNNSAEYGGAILLFSGGNQENRRSGNRRGSGAEITNIAQEGESAAMPIFNCTFADNTAQLGGAIYTENVSVSVENCRFMNNRAVWNQHIYDGTGGAICLLPVNREASLTISNSTFEQNNASRSGGAVASGPSTNIQGSRFVNNSAINAAGAVYIFTISSPLETEANVSDCRFLGNTAAYGGAIFTKEGSLTVHNSFFEHNTAVQNETPESGRGGAISHHPPSVHDSLCVSNSTFIQNIALVGGAIAFWSPSPFRPFSVGLNSTASCFKPDNYLYNCTFIENTAEWGGAIYAKNVSIIEEYNNFTNNSAVQQDSEHQCFGGAIWYLSVNRGDCLQSSNSSFLRNYASNTAGAIAIIKSQTNIQRSRFINNSADASGGAIAFLTTNRATIYPVWKAEKRNICNCTFLGNTAGRGGAIDATTTIVQRKGNVSNLGMAAVMFSGSINISFSFFKGNRATAGGGGAIWSAFHTNVSYSKFIQNTAGPTAGAIGSQFSTNVTSCYFELNSADSGGALYSNDLTIISLTNFTRNSGEGGAVICMGDLYCTSCIFINNTAM